ncbi:MAG: YbaK/EbsC family protein [Nitrososphaerales archaeon]|jgi:prolyl-tRNA editing enzyme YbaK/EbsC (Cys-tRNA(Pro) deacylase)
MEEEMQALLGLFEREGVEFRLYEHGPVRTSEEAARVRGVELRSGVKALLLKSGDGRYLLADLAADRRADLSRLRALAGAGGRLRLASREEVISVTGCEPGSVHPFGSLFGVPTYLDPSVLENEFVDFNIGLLTRSARIRSGDLKRLLGATIAEFAEPAGRPVSRTSG